MNPANRGLAAVNPGSGPAGVQPAELDWLHFAPHHASILDQTQATIDKVPAGTSTVLFEFQVPLHHVLVIKGIGFGSMSPSALVHAAFKISRNNETIGDYNDVPCVIGGLARPGQVNAFVHGPATVRIEVTNNYPRTAFRYIARVTGWMVPKVR